MPRFQMMPILEFEFFLATKLGMTVKRMRQDMDEDEFTRWRIYYGRKAQREELETLKAKNAPRGR